MKFIRATVDVVLDRFYPGRSSSSPSTRHRFNHPHPHNNHHARPTNRIDEDVGEQVEKVRPALLSPVPTEFPG